MRLGWRSTCCSNRSTIDRSTSASSKGMKSSGGGSNTFAAAGDRRAYWQIRIISRMHYRSRYLLSLIPPPADRASIPIRLTDSSKTIYRLISIVPVMTVFDSTRDFSDLGDGKLASALLLIDRVPAQPTRARPNPARAHIV